MIQLKVEGAEELASGFEQLRDAFSFRTAGRWLRQALLDALRAIFVPLARARAPRSASPKRWYYTKSQGRRPRPTNPVHMADSIDAHSVRAAERGDITVGAGPGKLHFWARFQEFGTKVQSARPFMRPTFYATKEALLAAVTVKFKERFEQALARVKKSPGGPEFPMQQRPS